MSTDYEQTQNAVRGALNESVGLTLDQYQHIAETTAVFPARHGIPYLTLGLVGEAGEVANKVKKWLRNDDPDFLDENTELPEYLRGQIIDECGDVLWYLALILKRAGYRLEEAAYYNIGKLSKRKQENTLKERPADAAEV